MGPVKELYLAEEGIGLAKSLSWTVYSYKKYNLDNN